MLFLFNFVPQQIANSNFFFIFHIVSQDFQTMSLVLNLSILAEILCVVFTLRHHSPATEKKFRLVELFFSRANERPCATTETGHTQRSYLTVT